MKTHTSIFKEQIKLIGKEIDSRITFGSTVLGKNDLNAVTPSYQGAILKSVMKQLDIDSNVAIPIGTILKYEFGLKVNGEYEYINYGNYVVYSVEKQEDTKSYKITCYDKLLYSMLDYVKLPITYPISIRDYINSISTVLGLKFANKSGTFANYDKQIQADLYDGLGYTFRDILDELAQVTASTICLNNNDELEIRYITETGDIIDEEYLKDVNVNFGEKFGKVNTIVLSRSADSDSVYYPSTLPANPYEIKISDNQIMNGNDRADFLPDIYNKLNGLEFYTNDFVSTGICYYDLCDRYSVKVGDNTYSCVMFNDEVLVTQGLEENIYTELPEQTETDYKHASKDDRMINQVYIIAKKNEAEILALVSTTETIQKEINPTKDESGSEIIIEDASNNPLTYLEIEGKSTQETRSGKNLLPFEDKTFTLNGVTYICSNGELKVNGTSTGEIYGNNATFKTNFPITLPAGTYTLQFNLDNSITVNCPAQIRKISDGTTLVTVNGINLLKGTFILEEETEVNLGFYMYQQTFNNLTLNLMLENGSTATDYEPYGTSPSPDYPSEIESVGYENLFDVSKITGKTAIMSADGSTATSSVSNLSDYIEVKANKPYTLSFEYDTLLNTAERGLCYYDKDKKFLRGKAYSQTGKKEAIAPTEDGYVRFSYDMNCYNIQVAEGEHSYIPYGKSGIEVKTVGKNLSYISSIAPYNYSAILENGIIAMNGTSASAGNLTIYLNDKTNLILKANTTYTFIVIVDGTITGSTYKAIYLKGNNVGSLSSDKITTFQYTPTEDTVAVEIAFDLGANLTFNCTIKIQVEKGNTSTEYQPYQKNTSLFVLNAPLRSLPNGIKDIAYIKNNKLYVDRYVGSVVLNGSESWATDGTTENTRRYTLDLSNVKLNNSYTIQLSNYFSYNFNYGLDEPHFYINSSSKVYIFSNITDINNFKTWLSTHNTQVDYELATPVTEEYGEIEMLKTLKGYNNISTTDDLLPIINLTYVRDTILADYVENHVAELKLTENEIKASVESVSISVDGLNTTIDRVEEITTDNSQVINIISTNIDRTTGEVREVTTTTGFTFNKDGMTIDDGSGFKAEHRANGTYYKDGESIVGEYTKDGSKQKDLSLFGTYSYAMNDKDATPMFVGQLFTNTNGEEGFGHFYNGGDY